MSSFFVSPAVIDDCVAISSPASMSGDDFADMLGQALWLMNVQSMQARYTLGDAELDGYMAQVDAYKYQEPKEVSEAQQLKSLDCWVYQTCDKVWEEGSRFQRMQELADVCRTVLSEGRQHLRYGEYVPFVAGYDAAEWDRSR